MKLPQFFYYAVDDILFPIFEYYKECRSKLSCPAEPKIIMTK